MLEKTKKKKTKKFLWKNFLNFLIKSKSRLTFPIFHQISIYQNFFRPSFRGKLSSLSGPREPDDQSLNNFHASGRTLVKTRCPVLSRRRLKSAFARSLALFQRTDGGSSSTMGSR